MSCLVFQAYSGGRAGCFALIRSCIHMVLVSFFNDFLHLFLALLTFPGHTHFGLFFIRVVVLCVFVVVFV